MQNEVGHRIGKVIAKRRAKEGFIDANMGSKMGGKLRHMAPKKGNMLDIVSQACSDANMKPQKWPNGDQKGSKLAPKKVLKRTCFSTIRKAMIGTSFELQGMKDEA